MPDLYPLSFTSLVSRLDREVARGDAVYSLAPRDMWVPDPDVDLSVEHLAGRVANSLGPASGPHTQMAQNIVLAWLAGARFMELKTVQILDTLEIPRPCIYVPNIGYNVEWSQELLVKESAYEYVKAWWLVHMLASSHGPGHWTADTARTIFDISVGYDLKGIQSEKVAWFLHTMTDASAVLAELKDEIAERFPTWAGVDVPARVSSSTTLSTFHGCPADEIEGIASHTMGAHGLHTVIKLNPTLLGHDVVRKTLDDLGYTSVQLDESAFDKDLKWDQLMEFLPRLEQQAKEQGLGLGVKFSNTLVCHQPNTPFTVEEMYLSGQPLHVLAVTLADKFRQATNNRLPISFSAGVDANNYWKLAGADIKPVTTCSDILKGQGYARLPRYLRALEKEMKKAGAKDMAAFVQSRAGGDDAPTAALSALAEETRADDRYAQKKNARDPKKIGSQLVLLDCITCDKCIKVCPNMSNIKVEVPKGRWDLPTVTWAEGDIQSQDGPALVVEQTHQIGNVIDLCNKCGQCDPWCPEDGGPYIEKAHLFLSRRAFDDQATLDGFVLEARGITWRKDGALRTLVQDGDTFSLTVDGGTLVLDGDTPRSATGRGTFDLRDKKIMELYRAGFLHEQRELFVD